MKNLFIVILFSSFSITAIAQKKKNTIASPKANVLAKVKNVTLENIKTELWLYSKNQKNKDSISVKPIGNSTFTDYTLKSFSSKNNTLYLLTYKEKSLVQSTNKTEDILSTYSEIYDFASKTKVFENIQKSTKITEKVFLDRLKNASETQEKIRNEGYTFSLLPNGDVSLTSKSKSAKLSFDAVSKKYSETKKGK